MPLLLDQHRTDRHAGTKQSSAQNHAGKTRQPGRHVPNQLDPMSLAIMIHQHLINSGQLLAKNPSSAK
jgi:hypothetical protein